jgi:HEAT repeat protein
MGNCDICNHPIDVFAKQFSSDNMRLAVKHGFRPKQFQHGGTLANMSAMLGISPAESMAGWLSQVEADTTNWALCSDCVAGISSFLAPQPLSTHGAAADTAVSSLPLSPHMTRWVSQIESAQKRITRQQWFSFLLGGLLPVVVSSLLWLFGAASSGAVCWGLVGSAAAWTGLYMMWPQRYEKKVIAQIANEIKSTVTAQKLATAEVAERVAEQSAAGGVQKGVLTAVDPPTATIIDIRTRSMPFFKKKTAVTETDAHTFRSFTLDFLQHNLYTEATAALGVMATIYTEIAPAFADNVDVNQLIQSTTDPTARMKLATRNVLSQFNFEDDIKAIANAASKRRQTSMIQLFLAAQQEQADTVAALAEESDALKPVVRDKQFVGACIDFLGKEVTQKVSAFVAITHIPDSRTLPHLLKLFDLLHFYPQGIDAVSRLGEDAHSTLLQTLPTGSVNQRFNICLALGIMGVDAARPLFHALLQKATVPLQQIGPHFGLVRLGDETHLDPIIQALSINHGDVCHAAAIALEHLGSPLPEHVFSQHLNHAHNLVRLRLVRALGSQKTTDPALINALINRFADSEENVREAAVTAVSQLDPNLVYNQIEGLTKSGTGTTQICAFQTLGKLGAPQAVPLLATTLQQTSAHDIHQAVITALADLNAIEAVKQIGRFLSSDNLSQTALWALIRLGFQDKNRVTEVLKWHGINPLQRLFALSLLGDEKSEKQFNAALSGTAHIQELLQACDFARILSNPDFAGSLRSLLTYNKQEFTPTDKFIPYAAFRALIHTLLADG